MRYFTAEKETLYTWVYDINKVLIFHYVTEKKAGSLNSIGTFVHNFIFHRGRM